MLPRPPPPPLFPSTTLFRSEPRTVVLVTHDVEEAIVLGDRVVVLSRRPGRDVATLEVDLARPRRRTHAAVVELRERDRKSTRLNSSHLVISYAVFCSKKKSQ